MEQERDAQPPQVPLRYRVIRKIATAYRIFCYVFAGLVLAGVPIAYAAGVRIVTTPSVPKGLWWVHPGSIDRYAFVNTCLPLELAQYGRSQGYLDEGSCPGKASAVMKMVIAVPGDHVSVTSSGISVNGHLIADSLPQVKDHLGHAVKDDVRYGESVVPSDTYWLLGLNVRSWDSRYFGPVSLRGMLGIGTPVLISLTPPRD
jgi:conjugative transfer signal peptidase TraF